MHESWNLLSPSLLLCGQDLSYDFGTYTIGKSCCLQVFFFSFEC